MYAQLGKNNEFLYTTPSKGHLCVDTVPDVSQWVKDTNVWVWITDKNPATDKDFGTNGSWELQDDNRKKDLWTAYNEKYTVGSDYNGQSYDGIGTLPSWLFAEEPEAPAPTLEEAQEKQLNIINAAFEQAAQALTTGYPSAEQLTWPTQQTEALAWHEDNNTPTPYLDGIAQSRGIDPAEMRSLAYNQVIAFQSASQQLVGIRQKLRDEIDAATEVEDVEKIVWPS